MFIEEAFERLLLDYDRVFSAMGIPACLWRRTGEIYKANREFAELVGVDGYMLRDVRLFSLFNPPSSLSDRVFSCTVDTAADVCARARRRADYASTSSCPRTRLSTIGRCVAVVSFHHMSAFV